MYGIDLYLDFYKYENVFEGIQQVYKKVPKEFNQMFVDYVNLFRIDEVVESRMDTLFKE